MCCPTIISVKLISTYGLYIDVPSQSEVMRTFPRMSVNPASPLLLSSHPTRKLPGSTYPPLSSLKIGPNKSTTKTNPMWHFDWMPRATTHTGMFCVQLPRCSGECLMSKVVVVERVGQQRSRFRVWPSVQVGILAD